MADLAGIGGGLIMGGKLLVLSSPIIAASALASAAGGFVEGGIVGFAGGYLLAEWLSGKSSIKNLIELEYKQNNNDLKPDFKSSPEYKAFEKSKMELYNKDQTVYDKAKDAVWTGVALSMGVVGAIIGAAGCCVLKGSLNVFVVTTAILGGDVKGSMIIADHLFGAPLHHLYCLGSSLEKAYVPIDNKFVNLEGTAKDSPSSIISIFELTTSVEM